MLLLLSMVGLTTLARIVMCTPFPFSNSIHYSSYSGRRIMGTERPAAVNKKLLSQLAVVEIQEEKPDSVFVDREDPEIAAISTPAQGLISLRAPPFTLNHLYLFIS